MSVWRGVEKLKENVQFPPWLERERARFISFLFSSLKHHFADGCVACMEMGSKEKLQAAEQDKENGTISSHEAAGYPHGAFFLHAQVQN